MASDSNDHVTCSEDISVKGVFASVTEQPSGGNPSNKVLFCIASTLARGTPLRRVKLVDTND
jgi:hypothetical protein